MQQSCINVPTFLDVPVKVIIVCPQRYLEIEAAFLVAEKQRVRPDNWIKCK